MNNSESDEKGVRLDSKPERLPPFGVLDLLILVSCLGLVFAFQEQAASFGWFGPNENRLIQLITRLVLAIQFGIPLAAIYWLVKQKRITGKFFWQPGHWMLFAICILVVLLMTALPISRELEDQSLGAGPGILTVLMLGNIVTAITFLVATYFVQLRWRGVFLTYFATELLSSCSLLIFLLAVNNNMNSNWMSWMEPIEGISNVAQLACFTCLLIAVCMDLVQRKQRGWLHWAGILVMFNLVVVNSVLNWVYARFFSP
jgi:hypothetical protein